MENNELKTTQVRILKAKIKDANYLECEYDLIEIEKEVDGSVKSSCTTHYIMSSNKFIHPDLLLAFQRIGPHVPLMCEVCSAPADMQLMLDEGRAWQDDKFKKYQCTGISIGGSDEHEGVTLVGRKVLKTKKVLNLIVPFTKFETPDHEEMYLWHYEMTGAVSNIIDEVKKFIIEGKCGKSPQLDLFNQEEDPNDISGMTQDLTIKALHEGKEIDITDKMLGDRKKDKDKK